MQKRGREGVKGKQIADERRAKDHLVRADPDIRGSLKGRRGIGDDARIPSGNDPGRVERMWAREKRK